MATGAGFLKFNSLPPRLHLTADDDEFDEEIISAFQSEGFDVTYLPWRQGGKPYRNELLHLSDDLELGESYAIIAYGNAATDCLDFHIKPQPHLSALITYYPTHILKPNTQYPPHLEFLCHIAGSQGFAPVFPSYTYKNARPGFAESDLEEYNKVAASLAWTRTLGLLRKAFKIEHSVDLEPIKEKHSAAIFGARDPKAAVVNMTNESYINHIPTMTGGIGAKDILLFYRDYFIPKNPPSLSMRLVSRTTGVDRVVDEIILSFKHTQEVPWMLPGVKATNKVVHVAIVSIVCIRGGKLYSEHVYWDQASVLVQIGLLDPKLVPESFRKQGLKRLPVYGSETAAKVLDEESQPSNDLMEGWREMEKARSGTLPARPKQAAPGASNSASVNGGGSGGSQAGPS